jgi:coenzyme F420-reducing hydrogenase alpha subunit
MKTIEINHIAKTEGHLSFVGALIDADFAEARIETEEGARLIEGIMLGRKFFEAPIITARICGICPIVHNLTSIKAMEQALNIKVTPEIIVLRKMLINAQWIHSHALHAFFLSFPDLVGISNNFDFVKKYPKEVETALELRDWGVQLSRIIGGRTVHPINSVIGGFNVEPDFAELSELMKLNKKILTLAGNLFDFAKKQKLPKFERSTNYVSLKAKGEYAIYDGQVFFSDNKNFDNAEKFIQDVSELVMPNEKVKRVQHLNRSFMVGALSRINNNFNELNPTARQYFKKLNIELPCYNSFYNIFAQILEIVHCVEETPKLFAEYSALRENKNFSNKLKVKFEPNPGRGYALMEAPRGILLYDYELDREGNIIHCNIITPTAMFLSNLEQDLGKYLLEIKKKPDERQKRLIKTLIRAYDPCISCATH